MSEEGEHRIGTFGSGVRIEISNRLVLLLAVARHFHGNSIFMKKELRQWTWESPSAVVQIAASLEQKCDSARKKKIFHCVGGRRAVAYDGVRLKALLTAFDRPIKEDPTKYYDLLLRGLRAFSESACLELGAWNEFRKPPRVSGEKKSTEAGSNCIT
ncbi:unnamed protein product [Strongylus vulgaris]|uniref:Uncharacterized protein n=1 Tax=Strongylus vulgaris TaxID=40348 RepID=A0A3P7JG05_STRVU|nr:unnamed protein product [Strongylus vulgaris]